MNVADFDFDLPPDLIAQEALARGESRLLVLDRRSGQLEHASIRDFPRFLDPADLLVANDTRVFPARLLGHRVPSGGAVEFLLLSGDRGPDDRPGQIWSALVHPGQKLNPGARVRFEGAGGALIAEILERQFFGACRVGLWAEDPAPDVEAFVDALGHMPLPPYIHRADTPGDRERYQTIFAAHPRSVGAPTARRHFPHRV